MDRLNSEWPGMYATPDGLKRCCKCRARKLVGDFYRNSHAKDLLSAACKTCILEDARIYRQKMRKKLKDPAYRAVLRGHQTKYYRSIQGWLRVSLKSMKKNSAYRGHPPPEIGLDDLLRMAETAHFKRLWRKYEQSGFESEKRPSIDRLDNFRGYTLDNVRLVTWDENAKAWNRDQGEYFQKMQEKSLEESWEKEGNTMSDPEGLGKVRKKTVGNFLRSARLDADLTQSEVAKALGYDTAQFVSNIERGLALPPFESLSAIAKLYGLGKREVLKVFQRYWEERKNLEISGLSKILKKQA